MGPLDRQTISVSTPGDVSAARSAARAMALASGFDEKGAEELAIAVTELASNVVRHARGGMLTLIPLDQDGRVGIQAEAHDSGPGLENAEQAMTDGYSTAGGLGYGLGTVNRLMDEFDITSQRGAGGGTHVICKKWARGQPSRPSTCPLDFGAATRPRPLMTENGDTFVLKHWNDSALAGVIDGLGHGQFAHRAAETARQYVESHFDQPLDAIFRGVGRACQATRGVVMALARFDWEQAQLSFASVGNIEVRVFGNTEPMNFVIRRGIIGVNVATAVVTRHVWNLNYIMVLHSDGVSTHWRAGEFSEMPEGSPARIAQQLLQRLAKDNDDATVVVVKRKQIGR